MLGTQGTTTEPTQEQISQDKRGGNKRKPKIVNIIAYPGNWSNNHTPHPHPINTSISKKVCKRPLWMIPYLIIKNKGDQTRNASEITR